MTTIIKPTPIRGAMATKSNNNENKITTTTIRTITAIMISTTTIITTTRPTIKTMANKRNQHKQCKKP